MSILHSHSPAARNYSAPAPVLAPAAMSDLDFSAWLTYEADRLAWVNDDDSNHFDDFDGYTPGWQDDDLSYTPTADDLAEYLAGELDGGCPVGELSDDERDLIVHTASDYDYRAAQYEAAEMMDRGILFA